jgi:hypothetical protein
MLPSKAYGLDCQFVCCVVVLFCSWLLMKSCVLSSIKYQKVLKYTNSSLLASNMILHDRNKFHQPFISFNITIGSHIFYFNALSSKWNYFLMLSLSWRYKSHSLWCHAWAMKGKTSTLRMPTFLCNITDIIFKTSLRLYQLVLNVFLSCLGTLRGMNMTLLQKLMSCCRINRWSKSRFLIFWDILKSPYRRLPLWYCIMMNYSSFLILNPIEIGMSRQKQNFLQTNHGGILTE